MADKLTDSELGALAELEWELGAPYTLLEIAEYLGYTQRAVEIIEARALAKLRVLLEEGDDWAEGFVDPPMLHRRLGAVFPSNGMAPTPEIES